MAWTRGIRRALLVGALMSGSLVAGAPRAWAAGGKSVKECSEELAHDTAVLEAAGESASTFFHTCWLHGEKGKPTPIVAKGVVPDADGSRAKRSGAQGPGASRRDADTRDTDARETDAYARGEASPRDERPQAFRIATREPRARGRYAARRVAPPETFLTVRRRREDDEVVASFSPPAADQVPGHLDLTIPLIGIMHVPIMSGMEPMVQEMVDNPIIPGLASLSP